MGDQEVREIIARRIAAEHGVDIDVRDVMAETRPTADAILEDLAAAGFAIVSPASRPSGAAVSEVSEQPE